MTIEMDIDIFIKHWHTFYYPVENVVIWPQREHWVLFYRLQTASLPCNRPNNGLSEYNKTAPNNLTKHAHIFRYRYMIIDFSTIAEDVQGALTSLKNCAYPGIELNPTMN